LFAKAMHEERNCTSSVIGLVNHAACVIAAVVLRTKNFKHNAKTAALQSGVPLFLVDANQ
jgi:hypothetical protein